MKTCLNIVVNIDSPNNTALVKWLVPDGHDNTGEKPLIMERNGQVPNARFSAGTHILRYNITDKAGNVGQSCSFQIQVQSLYCDPPTLNVAGASHMVYECPDRYRYGAECRLSCKSGYPLGGTNKIQCMNMDEKADPPILDWRWPKDALGPYCKESICADLRSPRNGATACDLWTMGRQCQIQCQSGYDFAFNFPDVYVCATNSGLWKPIDLVPDCSRKVTPTQARLMSDVYYYTGKCNSSQSNLHEIQTNFIKALNASAFNSVCLGEPFCKAEFVNITCGSVTTRRKRDANWHHLRVRSSDPYAYIIQFELLLSMDQRNQTISSQFVHKADTLQQMSIVIQNEMDSGHFDIHLGDLHLESDSFGPGVPSFKCPKGMVTRMKTGSCAGCPVGMFMSEKTSDCELCPVGTYQDIENSIACKLCPTDTNTTSDGSADIKQCKALCTPGSYSSTGLEPCAECSALSYQPLRGQTDCRPCGMSKRTPDVGAASDVDCQAYDILISKEKAVVISNITSFSNIHTVVTWLYFRSFQGTQSVFKIESPSNAFSIIVSNAGELLFDVDGSQLTTRVRFNEKEWTHLAVTVDQGTSKLSVFHNGQMVYDNSTSLLPTQLIYDNGGNFSIKGDIQMNSFYFLNISLPQSELQHFAGKCAMNASDAVISQDDIAIKTDANLILPSRCDDVNECSGSPCGSHQCINKLGAFECVCSGGFSGRLCDVPPDFCDDGPCMNGATCVSGPSNYTCSCPSGFHGTHCETQAKNGEWSEWSDWALCSKTCAGGVTTRRRRCDSPPPDVDGQPCNGVDTESKDCNTDKCPECPRLRRSYGLILHCNDTQTSKRCTVSCRPGLYFATSPLLVYECGRVTGYKWNHQTADNPHARLPTCSNVKPPAQVSVEFKGEYNIDPCDTQTADSLSRVFENKLRNTTCIQSVGCTHGISTTSCNVRRKRSQTTTVSISLGLNIDSSNLGTTLEKLLVNKTATTGLMKLLNNIKDLEKTAQEIFNYSANFLQVTVGGKNYKPLQTMPTPVTTVICPKGSVKLDIFCIVVPQGSYIAGTLVKPCPRDEYQDLVGQDKCKPCPTGATTAGIGSTALSDCIAGKQHNADKDHANKKEGNMAAEKDDPHFGVHVAVGVSVAITVVILAVIGVILAYKHLNKKRLQINDSQIPLQVPTNYFMIDKPMKE